MAIFEQYPILLPSAVIAVLAIAGCLIKFGEWKGSVNESRKSLEGFDKWKGEVNSDRKSFKEFMKEVRDKLDRIFDRIDRLPQPLIYGRSPLELTDYGKELSDLIKARKIAERLSAKAKVLDDVAGLPNYEIQAFCQDYLKKNFKPTEEESKNIKKCQYEKGVSRDAIVNEVIMIEFRDKLLELTVTTT